MRKFLTFVVTPILATILALIKIPDIEKWLKDQDTHAVLYIGIGVAAATVFNHFITVISPFKKYEKIEKNKWSMLGLVTSSFQDDYFKKNKLSGNVMIIKRCLLNKRQPNKKNPSKVCYNIFQRIFKVIWTYDGKPIDKRLAFTIKQGSSGLAYSYGKPVLIDLKSDGMDELNLSESQKKAASNLEFIISCPIFALDERYNTFSSNIIGILNISTSHPNSRHLIEKPEDRITLTNTVMDFSKICSLIM